MDVLIIDDNLDAAESLGDLLELAGNSVRICTSGEEALEDYQPHHFGVVFLDLKMPGIGGVETARRMLAADAQARIVIVTGNSAREDLETVQSLGIVGLLRKPYAMEELHAFMDN